MPHLPKVYEGTILPFRQKLFDIALDKAINRRLAEMPESGVMPLFSNIEIETINRCNGSCSFCAANREAERRPFRLMDAGLFESIVRQLGELGYQGSIGMYANNEPLLDGRIFEFCGMARRGVPRAFLYMLTNGSLLTLEGLRELMKHLDGLIINNYADDKRLPPRLAEVARYVEGEPSLRGRVFIYLRRRNEFRTNRGGTAPNRGRIIPLSSRCLMPFKQMVVLPDGRVSLCCCDIFGSMTMGDLRAEGLREVWHGSGFRDVRRRMLAGRGNISLCRSCDGLSPLDIGSVPHKLMRPPARAVISIAGE